MQPLDTVSCDLLLPPEGISAAANLFALIVEFELKGASYLIHREICFVFLRTRYIIYIYHYLWLFISDVLFYGLAASASAYGDENEYYLQASVAGKQFIL